MSWKRHPSIPPIYSHYFWRSKSNLCLSRSTSVQKQIKMTNKCEIFLSKDWICVRLVEVVIISISPPKRTFDHRCWLYLTKKVTKPTSYCTVAFCYVAADNPIPKNYYHLPLSYVYSSVYIYTLRKGQTQKEKKEREKGENREDTANQDRSHGVELSNDDESGKCICKSLSIHSL